ncbi:hypothetical protein [Arenimonas sp.]|uniref:hypothetical protein n=1 Tax=Arenimonas sp. TaxID=1872635 RepID=UPI002E37E684|nr:hypothetical protein [Arenimonas sp.]HEX4853103.1 hypothetical protein [Arenimonas sp.]
MSLRDLALAALVALSLAGCTARTAPASTASDPATEQAAALPIAPVPAAGVPLTAKQAANPNRSCQTDSDCAVKDVGNCCGYFPMCVNKDARTDPAAVRAQCEKDDMASICGFQEISACQCVDNQCQSLTDGAVDR